MTNPQVTSECIHAAKAWQAGAITTIQLHAWLDAVNPIVWVNEKKDLKKINAAYNYRRGISAPNYPVPTRRD